MADVDSARDPEDLRGGDWDATTITAILNDQQRRAHHIQAIMDMVQGQDWNGVDVDYEQLEAADSGTYMTFLRLLATELHRRHKLLAVAVPAKTAESADDPHSQAYQYDQIASVADEIRVMAYDHAWEESPPGSVAPTPWVQQVLNYAVRSVPPNKLMLGIAAYGYDWADGRGSPIGATSAAALAAQHRATVSWDQTSASACSATRPGARDTPCGSRTLAPWPARCNSPTRQAHAASRSGNSATRIPPSGRRHPPLRLAALMASAGALWHARLW